jgi:hypothetical protein
MSTVWTVDLESQVGRQLQQLLGLADPREVTMEAIVARVRAGDAEIARLRGVKPTTPAAEIMRADRIAQINAAH